jgi:hypothetical protein
MIGSFHIFYTGTRCLKTNVFTPLNKGLEALEDANIDAVQDVISFSKIT